MNFKGFTKKKAVALGLAFGVAAGTGGIAAAYFSAPATHGTGTGGIGTLSPFTVAWSGGNTGTTLTPQAAGTPAPMIMRFTVTNTGSASERLNTATATVDHSAGGTILTATSPSHAAVAGCQASWFTATVTTAGSAPASSPVPTNIGAGKSVSIAVPVKLVTSGTTQNACAGYHVLVTLTVN